MYGIYGNIYHQYTPNVIIYTIHGSYGPMGNEMTEGFETSNMLFNVNPGLINHGL